jgi:hypothetical protein
VLAGVTMLAVVASAVAVAAGAGHPEPPPLALMAGNGNGTGTERAAAPATPAAAATAAGGLASADSRSFGYPYGGWGLTFKVDGTLPSLPDHAAAWKVSAPALDRAAVARMAGALGVSATPAQRDGGWFADDGNWTLAAFPGEDMWSISYYRSSPGSPTDGAARESAPGSASSSAPGSASSSASSSAPGSASGASAGSGIVSNGSGEGPVGLALSRVDAEGRVRALLDRMGAPAASWRIETTETDIGVGWACAAPAVSSDELKKLEAEKLRQVNQGNPGANSASPAVSPPDVVQPTPADKPVPGGDVPQCPPPPAPVKGFNVAVFPVLDGHRVEWPVWNLTLRSDGRIENLYGSWVTFQRGGDYKLRGVDAALKELQSAPHLPAVMTEHTTGDGLTVDPAATGNGVSGSAAGTKPVAAGSTVAAPSRLPLQGGDAVPTPAIATPATPVPAPGMATPAIAPVCPPETMPLPPEKAASSFVPSCATPAPQAVTITGVELGLLQAPVFEDGRARLDLVPAYRFLGHFDNGTPWETSVIALHPDAIAPPPNTPVAADLRGTGIPTIGPAVPPTPPAPDAVAGKPSTK